MQEKRNDDYGHVLKYTSLFGGVQGLIILIGLVRNKFMAVLLGAGGMGLNALLVSVQNFSQQITGLGISFGAVPRLSEFYEQQRLLDYHIRVIRLWSLIAAVLGFVFCVLVSPLMNEASFTWGNHTLHYAMLGLSVARIQITSALFGLVVSLPLYYFLGHSGVVPVIVAISLGTMVVTLYYSWRYYPLRLQLRRQMISDGSDMVRLGMAFVLAAAAGSAAEMLIRFFLNVEGGLGDVGLYNAGFMITITYAGMVFSAMDSDYFPRLSAVRQDIAKTNETVNKQTEVSLLLLAPMLVALIMLLPILIPLLFSREFLSVVGMAQVAVLAMYFKVLALPVAYVTLARRASLIYLLLEVTYFVVLVAAVVAGYRWWGLWGTGLAIVIAHAVEFLTVNGVAYWRFGFRSTIQVYRYALIQTVIGVGAYSLTFFAEGLHYWIAEAALTFISTAYSIAVLRQKTHLWEALRRKFVKFV